MKGQRVLLDEIEGREAAALMVDGVLEDLLVAADAPAPGTIYRARAERPVKGQGGMFLSTPDGSAFLKQVKGLSPGTLLLVQVTGYAEPGKAIPVTTKVLFKSRYAIITPEAPGWNISRSIKDDDLRDSLKEIASNEMEGCSYGLILRSSCAEAPADEIAQDIHRMRHLAEQLLADSSDAVETLLDGDTPHELAWREWAEVSDVVAEPGCFESQAVLDAVDAALGERIDLPAGAYLFVEPTRAFVAVDVNTGADTSLAAGLKANLACARALPRVLRILGLGGQIVVDMAPMPRKERRQLEQTLNAALRKDTTDTSFLGWTALGHIELQRKRDRMPLKALLKG